MTKNFLCCYLESYNSALVGGQCFYGFTAHVKKWHLLHMYLGLWVWDIDLALCVILHCRPMLKTVEEKLPKLKSRKNAQGHDFEEETAQTIELKWWNNWRCDVFISKSTRVCTPASDDIIITLYKHPRESPSRGYLNAQQKHPRETGPPIYSAASPTARTPLGASWPDSNKATITQI